MPLADRQQTAKNVCILAHIVSYQMVILNHFVLY